MVYAPDLEFHIVDTLSDSRFDFQVGTFSIDFRVNVYWRPEDKWAPD